MSMKDDLEKALTLFKKPEIERVTPGQIADRRIEIIRPRSLAGLTGYVDPRPDDRIAGRIGTVKHYLPPDQQQVEFTRPRNVEAIATDELEFPRVCSWSFEDWMATYAVRDHRLYWAGGIKLDEIRKQVQYAGHVHQTYQVDTSSFGIETCPCCGKTGNSAIYCQTCERQGRETFICWGFVYMKGNQRFTRCPVCRNEAALTSMNVSQTGIFPRVRMR
jgi:hypothetical protein